MLDIQFKWLYENNSKNDWKNNFISRAESILRHNIKFLTKADKIIKATTEEQPDNLKYLNWNINMAFNVGQKVPK